MWNMGLLTRKIAVFPIWWNNLHMKIQNLLERKAKSSTILLKKKRICWMKQT